MMRAAEATDLPWGSAIDEAWRAAIDPGRADGRLVAESAEREQEASEVPLPDQLHPDLRAALERSGITTLYAHQLEALRASETANVIVTSGTASGKSLAFNMPVLDAIARDPKVRALYLYPTKALAQDQARKLAEIAPGGLRPAIYDGDTPREERPAVRRGSNLILTNPDMLHVGVLPHHRNWGDVFANLRFVVVDEATSIAASSGPTSPTSSGGSAGSPHSTAPSRASSSPRRRSPTRSSSPSGSSARRSTRSTATRPRGPAGGSRSGTRR